METFDDIAVLPAHIRWIGRPVEHIRPRRSRRPLRLVSDFMDMSGFAGERSGRYTLANLKSNA